MDKGSIGGVLLAIAGIVAGLLIEGGNLGQIVQPTAALIVFGGTMGAVLLQFPLTTVAAAFRSLAHIFDGLGIIPVDANAICIITAKFILGLCIPLVRCGLDSLKIKVGVLRVNTQG